MHIPCGLTCANIAAFLAVVEHVSRIVFTFADRSPVFATVVLVFAIANVTTLFAVGQHVSWVRFAFSYTGPMGTTIVFILTFRSCSRRISGKRITQ